jgi:hypothetical protein
MLHFLQKTSFALLICLCISRPADAQKKVVLEMMRCYSTTGPSMKYLLDPNRQQVILQQLNTSLLKEHDFRLTDTAQIPIALLTPADLKKNIPLPSFSSDTSLLHLYIDCKETDPFTFFLEDIEYLNDSLLARRSLDVIHLSYFLLNYKKQLIEENELVISLTHKETTSIGIPFNRFYTDGTQQLLSTTATGFTETIKVGIQYLFNPNNSSSLIELKVPPVYFYNNFIDSETYKTSKIIVPVFQNNTWQFLAPEGNQIIRNGEQGILGVKIEGKKMPEFPGWLFDTLSQLKEYRGNNFICLQRESRNVLQDVTYQTRLVGSLFQSATNTVGFLPANKKTNFLLKNKDTLAVFSINSQPIQKDSSYLWLNQCYNGIELSSIFSLDPQANPFPMITKLEINGELLKQPFSIYMKGIGYIWKEIYLQGEQVMLIFGKDKPERILIKNKSLSTATIQQLLLIAHSITHSIQNRLSELPQ